ncbi:alkaline phytoceramidase [Neoconidiobolus thromboides FSU 785]|nr:alkaline phytoceramidase [Neoconidiobolus thromboides FSU 785]
MYYNTTQTAGYWGDITSSVDWCEPNYVHSPYVAETFNTLSSLAMVLIGELGARMNHSTHWKQKCTFHMITVIGIGSILFHMTLKYYTQMLDELPMVWTSSMMFNLTIETRFQNCPSWVSMLIFLYAVSSTLITSIFQGDLQVILFRVCFAITTYTCVVLGFQKFLETERNTEAGIVFQRGFWLFLSAFSLWVFENSACSSFLGNGIYPTFHGLWHILVSLGIYHLIVYSNYLHQNRFKMVPSKIEFYYCVPFLVKILNY